MADHITPPAHPVHHAATPVTVAPHSTGSITGHTAHGVTPPAGTGHAAPGTSAVTAHAGATPHTAAPVNHEHIAPADFSSHPKVTIGGKEFIADPTNPTQPLKHGEHHVMMKDGKPMLAHADGSPVMHGPHPVMLNANHQPILMGDGGKPYLHAGRQVSLDEKGNAFLMGDDGKFHTHAGKQVMVEPRSGQAFLADAEGNLHEHNGQHVSMGTDGKAFLVDPKDHTKPYKPIVNIGNEKKPVRVEMDENGNAFLREPNGAPLTHGKRGDSLTMDNNGKTFLANKDGSRLTVPNAKGDPEHVMLGEHGKPIMASENGEPVTFGKTGHQVHLDDDGNKYLVDPNKKGAFVTDKKSGGRTMLDEDGNAFAEDPKHPGHPYQDPQTGQYQQFNPNTGQWSPTSNGPVADSGLSAPGYGPPAARDPSSFSPAEAAAIVKNPSKFGKMFGLTAAGLSTLAVSTFIGEQAIEIGVDSSKSDTKGMITGIINYMGITSLMPILLNALPEGSGPAATTAVLGMVKVFEHLFQKLFGGIMGKFLSDAPKEEHPSPHAPDKSPRGTPPAANPAVAQTHAGHDDLAVIVVPPAAPARPTGTTVTGNPPPTYSPVVPGRIDINALQ